MRNLAMSYKLKPLYSLLEMCLPVKVFFNWVWKMVLEFHLYVKLSRDARGLFGLCFSLLEPLRAGPG